MNAEAPEAVKRLDLYLAAARVAHETTWELYSKLTAAGREDAAARARLFSVARLVTIEMPALVRRAAGLRDRWNEQELLDPAGAERTLRELERELERIAPELDRMRQRQDEVARDFRRRVRGEDLS